ncbi:MAG: hypothetical protein WC936_03620 [Candidatus Nanoarchaeia archaeon]
MAKYTITHEYQSRFASRFTKQKADETVYQQQCHQIMINDWENNIPVDQKKMEKRKAILEKWREIL